MELVDSPESNPGNMSAERRPPPSGAGGGAQPGGQDLARRPPQPQQLLPSGVERAHHVERPQVRRGEVAGEELAALQQLEEGPLRPLLDGRRPPRAMKTRWGRKERPG